MSAVEAAPSARLAVLRAETMRRAAVELAALEAAPPARWRRRRRARWAHLVAAGRARLAALGAL